MLSKEPAEAWFEYIPHSRDAPFYEEARRLTEFMSN